jgi:hypothetical protein
MSRVLAFAGIPRTILTTAARNADRRKATRPSRKFQMLEVVPKGGPCTTAVNAAALEFQNGPRADDRSVRDRRDARGERIQYVTAGVSAREIGRTLGVARSTIQDNLGRARAAGIGRSCGTARSLRARRGTWPHARTGGRDRLHRWVG